MHPEIEDFASHLATRLLQQAGWERCAGYPDRAALQVVAGPPLSSARTPGLGEGNVVIMLDGSGLTAEASRAYLKQVRLWVYEEVLPKNWNRISILYLFDTCPLPLRKTLLKNSAHFSHSTRSIAEGFVDLEQPRFQIKSDGDATFPGLVITRFVNDWWLQRGNTEADKV